MNPITPVAWQALHTLHRRCRQHCDLFGDRERAQRRVLCRRDRSGRLVPEQTGG
jgi:hypothetical protein